MDEYNSLVTLPSREGARAWKYMEHDHQQRLLQFFMGLNDSYVHILPTVGQAYSLLSQEESHRVLSSIVQPASVFYSKQGQGDDRRKDVILCEHCGWNGHIKANCYKLVRYPPGPKFYKPLQGKGNSKRFDKPKIGPTANNTTGGDSETASRAGNNETSF